MTIKSDEIKRMKRKRTSTWLCGVVHVARDEMNIIRLFDARETALYVKNKTISTLM